MVSAISSVLGKPNAAPGAFSAAATSVGVPVAAAPATVAVAPAAPVHVAAPVNVIAPAAVVAPEPAVGVAHVPAQVGTAISKTVQYAETPVVTGYTSTLYKSDLSAYDTPFRFNHNQRYLRPVKTVVPKIMPLEPKAHLAHVELPIIAPAVREVEIHPPILPEIRMTNPVVYPPVITPLI